MMISQGLNCICVEKNLFSFRTKCFLFPRICVRFQHKFAVTNASCEYPPIHDQSKEGKRRLNRQMWYDSIKSLPTVEQKLLEISYQQIMKAKKYLLSPVAATYSAVNFQHFITRTHLVKGLPDKLSKICVEKELLEIKDTLNGSLQNHFCNNWTQEHKNFSDFLNEGSSGSQIVNQFLLNIYKKMSQKNDYIWDSTIQQKPRISSFFWHQGFESKIKNIYEENLCFCYNDVPATIVRTKTPLTPILDSNDPLCMTAEVPNCQYHPKALGISYNKQWLSSVPGFWPGDPNEFPFLVVKTPNQMNKMLQQLHYYDLEKVENGLGIMASFGLLNSFATHQGFTPFHDLTYPLTTQLILTNGQDFTFFVYQLNTIAFHVDVDRKDRRNICWTSGKMRLFDTVEDGVVKGVNDEVYKVLLRFLLNAPVPREGVELKPHLGEDRRTPEQAAHDRLLIRRMFSQVPWSHAHEEEVPTWVRIYKLHPDAPPSPYVRLA